MNLNRIMKKTLTFMLALVLAVTAAGLSFAADSPSTIYAGGNRIIYGPGASVLGGARITMLANQTDSQMMSFVIETKSGKIIVVDGGTPGDAGHLREVLQTKGGHVTAWLITHPHSDHVGALDAILRDPSAPIQIDNVYYSFAPIEWYYANEEYRAGMVSQIMESLALLPAEKLHPDIVRGQQIQVDDVTITVMNQPYLFASNAINNSSVAYTLTINGKKAVFLGDMGEEAGNSLLHDYEGTDLKCDLLQMAHHGQYGVTEAVYRAFRPSACMWPTPGWLWENDNGGGTGSGPWYTLTTRQWMESMGVVANYCIKDGDQVIE